MTLRDSFYHITSCNRENGNCIYTVKLNPEHFIYKAHFPNKPITPGVCIMAMATELAGDCLSTELTLIKAKNIKFLSPLSPLSTNEVNFTLSTPKCEEDGKLKISFTVWNEETIFAKLSLSFNSIEKL